MSDDMFIYMTDKKIPNSYQAFFFFFFLFLRYQIIRNENMTNSNSSADIKCIVIQQTFTGKRELKVTTVPKPPSPADGEVLIAVKAW